MIITLKGANFSASNIGTLSTYSIRFNSNGITNANTSVDRETNTGYTATITFKENYELNGAITVTMGGADITSTAVSGLNINISKVTGNVVITVPAKSTVVEPETPTYYTITYKYMSGSTEIKTATTEQVVAGTIKTFSTTDSRAQVSGYTCSSVSPSGQQTINNNITVTYNYTVNAVTPPATGDTGTIRWTNHGYMSSGGGLTANTKRAMARIPVAPGDIIRIEGLDGFTMVDLVAFEADGETTLGYTGATASIVNLTYENGVVTFQAPTSGIFTNCAYVGLVMKKFVDNSEVVIDVSTLPATYSKILLPVINQKFDSKTFTMMTESTRIALREPAEVKENRTITITNIPDTYLNDLSPVDMVFYDANKTYKKYSSSYTMNFSGSDLVITIPSSTEIGTYVNVTMKCTSDASSNIATIKFINSTITSA